MEQDTEVTEVIFRKFKDGDVIALFPYLLEFRYKSCLSYMHIGQHGEATLNLIYETKLATEEEYKDLYSELISLGYKLRIIRKMKFPTKCLIIVNMLIIILSVRILPGSWVMILK